MDAKELTRWWSYFSNKERKDQAKHMIENAKEFIIHEVNKLTVFKLNGHYEVINKESLSVRFYDTEKECIDYCLDVYPNSFLNTQTEICFINKK